MKVLVLGDSLSDGGWKRDSRQIGSAWPGALDRLCSTHGIPFTPVVRAEGGSRSVDVLETFRSLEREIWGAVAVLAGANDLWRRWVPWGGQDPVDEDDFRRNLRSVARLARECGVVSTWILTPCMLHSDPDHPWNDEVRLYRGACREAASLEGATLVPVGEDFEAAVRSLPEVKWTYDGVHPRPIGHERIAWTVFHHALGGQSLPANEVPPRPEGISARTWP